MSAATRVLENTRLRSDRKVSRRDSLALAVWSALAFQRPLAQPRLEEIRANLLDSARVAGLEVGRRCRCRRTVSSADSQEDQNRALQWNAVRDQEEVTVLRWTLAKESKLLARPYAEVRRNSSLALARGLDLGWILDRPPELEHFKLALSGIPGGHMTDVEGLLRAIGDDRELLAAELHGHAVIKSCPRVFPLFTALSGEQVVPADAVVQRSLREWCRRALLESGIARRLQDQSEGS